MSSQTRFSLFLFGLWRHRPRMEFYKALQSIDDQNNKARNKKGQAQSKEEHFKRTHESSTFVGVLYQQRFAIILFSLFLMSLKASGTMNSPVLIAIGIYPALFIFDMRYANMSNSLKKSSKSHNYRRSSIGHNKILMQ